MSNSTGGSSDCPVISYDHSVSGGGDTIVNVQPIEVVLAPGSFPLLAGHINPWPDKENVPIGWEVVGELGGRITENPGDLRLPIVSGVWIRKV